MICKLSWSCVAFQNVGTLMEFDLYRVRVGVVIYIITRATTKQSLYIKSLWHVDDMLSISG